MLKTIANGPHDSSLSPLVVLVLVLVFLLHLLFVLLLFSFRFFVPPPSFLLLLLQLLLFWLFSHPLLFLVLLVFLQNEVCFRKAFLSASSLVHAIALNPKEHSSDSGENSSDTCATFSTF